MNLRSVDAGMRKKFARRVDVCPNCLGHRSKSVAGPVECKSLYIPARFVMFFKALLDAPNDGALRNTNRSLASFGLFGIHDLPVDPAERWRDAWSSAWTAQIPPRLHRYCGCPSTEFRHVTMSQPYEAVEHESRLDVWTACCSHSHAVDLYTKQPQNGEWFAKALVLWLYYKKPVGGIMRAHTWSCQWACRSSC